MEKKKQRKNFLSYPYMLIQLDMLIRWTRATSTFAVYVLIIVNVISIVFATILFALSLWIIASPDTLQLAIETFGTASMKVLLTENTLTLPMGVGLAAVAAFIFFVSFMGFYGAVTCSQFLLFMYSTLVLLLLLLECALMFYFSTNIVEKGVNEKDGEWLHLLRLTFNCCDHNMTSQNISSTVLPWSCCGVGGFPNNCTVFKSSGNDCQQTFTIWLDTYETPIYVGLAVLHVLLSSCSLVRRACSASRPHT